MADDDLAIRIESRSNGRSPRRKKHDPWRWAFAAAAVVCLSTVISIFEMRQAQRSPAPPHIVDRAPAERTAGAPGTSNVQAASDATSPPMWTSPTAGSPLSLAYVPAGTPLLIHLRPATLLRHAEGERIAAALGPWGRQAVERLESLVGAPLAEIDALLLAVVVGPGGDLDAALRATPIDRWDDEQLARRFPGSQPARHGERSFRQWRDRALWLAAPPRSADSSAPRALVACPLSLVDQLIDTAGNPPPFVPDMQDLLSDADAGRAFTLIGDPRFLRASGAELIDGAQPLRAALAWLMNEQTSAIALSAHWDENFFIELRAEPAVGVPARRLAVELHQRIDAAPDRVEEYILASSWQPYGREVLTRLPRMLRALARYTRTEVDERQALARTYLPAAAGHNLLMGAELLLTESSAEPPAAGADAAAPPSQNLEDRLAAKTSLAFPKDSLEGALELLAEDAGIEIAIEGADLQAEGITKNQSLTLDARDRSVAEILVEILCRANPDRTAQGPADPKQKLVYVVEPASAGGAGRIIVTTRRAANTRGQPLPAEFAPSGR
jgi:hypothetical protein